MADTPIRANAQTRSHWTKKINAKSMEIIKAMEDLYVMIADAAEAGVKQADIAYNLADFSTQSIRDERGTGIHATAIKPKVELGQAIRERRKSK